MTKTLASRTVYKSYEGELKDLENQCKVKNDNSTQGPKYESYGGNVNNLATQHNYILYYRVAKQQTHKNGL